MAITLDETIGGASANTYATAAEFRTYCDERLNVADYYDANGDESTRALVMAFRRLNRENWRGVRVNSTQIGAWPRVGVAKPDPVGYGGGWDNANGNMWPEQYASTEIPQLIKDAQCELALAYLRGFDEYADRAKETTMDGFSVKMEFAGGLNELPGEVLRLISPLIQGARLQRA